MEDDSVQKHVDLIREVFLYAKRFQNKRFVIQIGSNLIEDPRFAALAQDFAVLHQAGIQVVLVPGATNRINQVLASYGQPTQTVKNIRVSTDEAMPLIKMAAFDVANEVLTRLSSQKIDAVIGNWARARVIGVYEGIDYHNTGLPTGINRAVLEKLLAEGHLPIFPCIGWSATGKPYNVSSLELATVIAEDLKAKKLFFLDTMASFDSADRTLPDDGALVVDGRIARMTVGAAQYFADQNSNLSQMEYDVLRLSCQAAAAGVQRVHCLDGTVNGAILREVFSTVGQGTMIHADEFEHIRPMSIRDIPAVLRVMEPSIRQGILIPRDETCLLRLQEQFVVYESDQVVQGCCALLPYGSAQAEVAALAVAEGFGHFGIGAKLINYVLAQARERGFSRLFLLTTQASDYFESIGFARATLADLPAARQKTYDRNRNSRIYALSL